MYVSAEIPAALIGAVLPGDFKIKKSKLRGEESFGMLCSEKELGLAGGCQWFNGIGNRCARWC